MWQLSTKKIFKKTSGFTLMETVVVLAVFATTITIATDLFFTITREQRRTQNVQAVQSDASLVLEAMAREITVGTIDYGFYKAVCTTGPFIGDYCPNGNSDCDASGTCGVIDLTSPTYILATRDQENNQIFYRRSNGGSGDIIQVCSNNSEDFNRCNTTLTTTNWQQATPIGVKVTNLKFYIAPSSNPFSTKNSCTIATQDVDCDSGQCVNYLCVIPDQQPTVTVILETISTQSGSVQEKISLQTTATSMFYKR